MRQVYLGIAALAVSAALVGCGDDRKNSIPTVDKNATPPKLNTAGSGDSGGGAKKPANTGGPSAVER